MSMKTKTPIRFVSEGKTAIKVTVPTPEGSRRFRSVGFKKIGREKAIELAVKERDRIGKEEWGKFWPRVLSDQDLLSRLPRNLEPTLRIAPDKKSPVYEYVANWMKYKDGKRVKAGCRYSCREHGKLGAYTKAKQALLNAYHSDLALLSFMGRAPNVTLQ
ncbi:Fe3+-citrate ABC transporter substrate-binding protein [Vibrio sp. YT-17]|uniref:Fe3+-citrate ABC transporter substrate-binding protein n=1 Tax=Vibrio sp. YT-17 TaxID=3074708 RepID=UPI00296549FE|nr:Fe3+-citrate ABC transporter substrate-binding protein [Vibrio sp. YT-17]MDW1542446.1 Fe3+-citrate ABC transporter substrate-binding protein [Vibrio sp. YT-17]